MAKLSLSTISSRYGSTDALNANFSSIEDAVDNTLSRDGTTPNEMEANLDMNSNAILNVSTVYAGAINLGGVNIEAGGAVSAATVQVFEFTASAGQTSFSISPLEPSSSNILVEVNGLVLPTSSVSTSSSTLSVPPLSAGDEVVVRVFTREVGAAPTATEITYSPAGTGAATRTVQGRLQDVPSVKDFGAVGDNATDDTAAFNAAFAALNDQTITHLYIPAGNYKITGALTTITRSGVSITGAGPRQSVLRQQSSTNTIVLSSTTPTVTRLSDVAISDLGINQGDVTNPSAGVALLVTRVDRAYFTNIDIRNVFQGVVIEGGGDQHWANTTITGSPSFTSLATGSNLLEIRNLSGTTEVPSEIFFTNFNIKGVGDYGGAHYLASCVVVKCCDGLFFDTGHCGFAYSSLFYINPQNNASLSCMNIELSNVYIDGNGAGDTTASALWLAGSTTPTVMHIKVDGCVIKNYLGNGVNIDLSTAKDIRITNTLIADNGAIGVSLIGVSEVVFANNTVRANNVNNSSSNAVALDAVTSCIIANNQILTGEYAHPVGVVTYNTCTDISILGNILGTHTTNISLSGGSTRVSQTGNIDLGNAGNSLTNDSISITVLDNTVRITTLPVSASGLSAGDLWNDGGTVKVVS